MKELARPDGFEPPTTWFVARYSIQLSYGRVFLYSLRSGPASSVAGEPQLKSRAF
jgi:hypothetical protein